MLSGRDYIIPEDVQRMAPSVLTHRIILSPDARMKGYEASQVLRTILKSVAVPVKLP